MASVPTTLEYVAVIVAEPLETAVTTPVEETVATSVLEDVHVAVLVTSWLTPDTVAVAVNCAVAPTAGAVPVMLTADTELGLVGESPHATATRARMSASPDAMDRNDIQTPLRAGRAGMSDSTEEVCQKY